jgi:hypothetical protein
VKDASKIYVQTNDGRKDQNSNKDVINVDSDKFDDTLPLPFNDTVVEEVNSKASKAVLVGPSSSILNKSKTIPPHISNQTKNTPPVLQQNRFSLLDSPSEDSPHTPNHQNNFLPLQNNPSTNNSTTQSNLVDQNTTNAKINPESATVPQPVLKKNPVAIPVLTPVLTHVVSPNPAETFKKLDLALEAELNAKLIANNTVAAFVTDLSDSSSQDSFVADSTHLEVSHPSSTPERVKRDMVFLKNSWANMAELEENEALHVSDADPSSETLNSADGFHVKLSKAKKKAHKRGVQSSKDSYATRSKVFQKPFK